MTAMQIICKPRRPATNLIRPPHSSYASPFALLFYHLVWAGSEVKPRCRAVPCPDVDLKKNRAKEKRCVRRGCQFSNFEVIFVRFHVFSRNLCSVGVGSVYNTWRRQVRVSSRALPQKHWFVRGDTTVKK